MKVAISIEHPAWIHQFRQIILRLQKEGHEVLILAIDKDGDIELLEKFGLDYELVGNSTGKNVFDKAWLLFSITFKMWLKCRKFKPDVFIGRASPMLAMNAAIAGKPHLIFEDTERSTISLKFCQWFSKEIITPTTFRTNLGPKQKRMPTYKELFYLHPDYFQPDRQVIRDMGIKDDERFVFIRFVSWNASHDIGFKGYSEAAKRELVEAILPHAKVLISSEEKLADDLAVYQVKVPFEKIHHVLYYASAYVGEGATMASEAAVLGTHAIFVSQLTAGSLDEQEKAFDLVFNADGDDRFDRTRERTLEWLGDPQLEEKGREKRKKLLQEKTDINGLFIQKIESYTK
ncbi:DUF354 domain-containing protein [bacterium SCSIO 12741]|nr:DUF354 domain-containing protein [bacterium SCSIO 12741]